MMEEWSMEELRRNEPVGVFAKLRHFTSRVPHTYLAVGQGIYFFLAGIWPLISIDSFVSVTGPKTDIWLVKTVGLLIMVIGLSLFVAGIRWRVSLEILLLALGSAAALGGIEIFYVMKGRISAVYLLDALIELVLVAWWASIYLRGFSSPEICALYDPALARPQPGEQE
jgi:hypothetical protein